jgi:hypothetical protein
MAFSLTGVAAVPDPSTWAMMLVGVAGLGFMGFRHSHKRAPSGPRGAERD